MPFLNAVKIPRPRIRGNSRNSRINPCPLFSSFPFLSQFEFVSDFGFRISDFWLGCGSAALCCLSAFLCPPCSAATADITSVADTTLSENYANHNLGGVAFVNSGTTQNLTRNRGLFRFDVAGSIPAGSLITSASLTLEVIKQPADGYTFADFGLYRLLQSWGEGDKTSPTNGLNPGSGSAATAGEATWFYRYAFTNAWSAPGAAATNDHVEFPSATQTIYSIGDSPYTFGPSPELTADLQFWLDHPAGNFGWILICQDEASAFTARRFASREDTNRPPHLQIEYLVPPSVDQVSKVGSQFNLSFVAQPGQNYSVQFRDAAASGIWQLLQTVDPQTNLTRVAVADPASAPQRFYRIISY